MGMHRWGWALPAALGIFAAGCGDDDVRPGSDAAVSDAAVPDAGALDAGPPDAGTLDAGPPPSCREFHVPDTTFSIAPGFRRTQIHPNAVFDGEDVWVTFTADEVGSSSFDVFLTKVNCNGSSLEPVRVNTVADRSDLNSDLAVGPDGELLVVWGSDNGSGSTGNITTWARRWAGDAFVGDAFEITTERGGAAFGGTTWMPSVAGRGDGYALVGTRGVEEVSNFVVYEADLSREGMVSRLREPALVMGAAQSEPRIAVDAEGRVHVAYTEDGESVGSMYAGPEGEPRRLDEAMASSQVSDLVLIDGTPIVATTAGGSSTQVRLHRLAEEVSLGEVGEPSQRDAGGVIAVGDGLHVLAWLRNVRGFRNELHAVGFHIEDGNFVFGDIHRLDTDGRVPPYPPTVVHLRDDTFAFFWAEGDNPEFEVKLRILQL